MTGVFLKGGSCSVAMALTWIRLSVLLETDVAAILPAALFKELQIFFRDGQDFRVGGQVFNARAISS